MTQERNYDARLMNRNVEAALLATACHDPAVAERVAGMEDYDFTVPFNQQIQSAIRAAVGHTGGAGITPELVEATLGAPLPPDWPDPTSRTTAMGYAGLLTDLSWRRRTQILIRTSDQRLSDIKEASGSLEVYQSLQMLDMPPSAAAEMDFEQYTAAEISKRPRRKGLLHTGFRGIDAAAAWRDRSGNTRLGGISTGSLVCPAAQTNFGKSRFGIELTNRIIMCHHRRYGQRRNAMVFSGEMDGIELLDAGGANPAVPTHRWTRAYNEAGFGGVPLMVLSQTDIGAIDIHGVIDRFVGYVKREVRSARAAGITDAKEIRKRLPLVVFIDYGALYVPTGMDLTKGLAEVFWKAKQLAMGSYFNKHEFPELATYAPAVIMPAQLKDNKEMAQRGNIKLPTLDDLEWSRTLANHIDIAYLLSVNPTNYDPVSDSGDRLVVVGKNRSGGQVRGGIPLVFENGQWASSRDEIGKPFLGYANDIIT